MLKQPPHYNAALIAIGGLIFGISTVLKSLRPEMRVICIPPIGPPTQKQS